MEEFKGKKYDLSTKEGESLFKNAVYEWVDNTLFEAREKRRLENIEARDLRRLEKKELEDKGWHNLHIIPEKEVPIVISEPELMTSIVYDGTTDIDWDTASTGTDYVYEPEPVKPDPKEVEIAKLKEQLAALEALKELNKEELAEIIEDVKEEEGE